MNSDLIQKALDQAKVLQKTVGEAIGKGTELAHPIIDDAVAKAGALRETLAHSAADVTEYARPHLDEALVHVNDFIAQSKDALTTGVAKAQEQLEPLAAQLRKTVESTATAMAKKPAPPAPEQDSDPH